MSSLHQPMPRKGATEKDHDDLARSPTPSGPKFTRFNAAMAAARKRGRLHTLSAPDDAESSLPLNDVSLPISVPPNRGLQPKLLFEFACIGLAVLAVVVASPSILSSFVAFSEKSGDRHPQVLALADNPRYEAPMITDTASDSDTPAKDEELAPRDDPDLAADRQRRPTVAARLDLDELTGEPIDPAFRHAVQASSGPSAALKSTSEIQATIGKKAATFGARRTTSEPGRRAERRPSRHGGLSTSTGGHEHASHG